MNLYQQRVLDARKEFLKLNKKQERELLRIYQELAKQLSGEIASCRTSSSKRYLSGMEEIVQACMNELNGNLNSVIEGNIKSSSEIASSTSLAYYENITDDIKLRSMFNKSVIKTSSNTVKKLIQGNYYSDGKTLDHRIWNITRSNAKDIDALIKVNVAKGANSRELAKQVDKYVNPLKRTEAKTFVSGMSKNVSYQAQRLARTSITHSFAETTIENAKNNPFNIGLRWNLSSSHRKHDICDDYAGKVFEPDEVPIQHPNCLCYFTEENEDIDKAIKKLKSWNNGESNSKLDELLQDYFEEFEMERNQSKVFSELGASKQVNSGIISDIRRDIRNGKYPLEILEGKQGKHILGHNNYIEGRSYLTISVNEAQELVNKYAGSGVIRLNQNNKWDNKELITADKEIGVNVNNMTNQKLTTNKCKIHYSKKGTHIVPTKKE